MVSFDLYSVVGLLAMWHDERGDLIIPATRAHALIEMIATAARQVEAMEAMVVPAAARALPPGVTDLSAERRRRQGGAA